MTRAPKQGRAGVYYSLAQLGPMAAMLKQEQQQLLLKEQEEQRRREERERERQLFALTVGVVTPLRHTPRASTGASAALPLPLQFERDEQQALLESISDDFDVSSLLDTDEALSYRQTGIGLDVARKLRQGHWSIQATLDLHGLRLDEARVALGQFIREHHSRGLRCVRIVHGKGNGSPGRVPVLKVRVQRWLVQKKEVLTFVQARASEGGAGAVVVLLDRVR